MTAKYKQMKWCRMARSSLKLLALTKSDALPSVESIPIVEGRANIRMQQPEKMRKLMNRKKVVSKLCERHFLCLIPLVSPMALSVWISVRTDEISDASSSALDSSKETM